MSQQDNNAIPDVVKRRVKVILNSLRELAAALNGVQLARGSGYILALELRDRTPNIRHGLQRLDEFRVLARKNGVDAEVFIQSCGGVPDFEKFGYHPNAASLSS
uniref:hypothetical protein n=1 Tax=Burkholderia sp. M701 TaxID=326454 RepID=UPI0012EBFB4E|nr:hypothetical protein [Burkholderia sp. M701]